MRLHSWRCLSLWWGREELASELNSEILFCVDIFSPVSILEPLFLGISLLAQELIEQENIWRPATKYTEKHHHSIWPEHFRFGELLG